MKTTFWLFWLLTLMATPVMATPLQKDQVHAVEELGNLNGVALNCRYFEQVKRIKQILIDHLPKQRELGQVFEDTTNEAFLRFSKSGHPCPSPVEFSEHIEEAGDVLQQVFSSR